MERREELLNAVREHALPLGPFGDLYERNRLELEWEQTLTESDCLELLGWIRDSYDPETTNYWSRCYAQKITIHVGHAGRRYCDNRLLSALLDLLGDPLRCDLAFDAIFDLEESAEYDNLLIGTATRVPINVKLAQHLTANQAEQLERVASLPNCSQDVRIAIRDILNHITRLNNPRFQ